MSLATLAGLKAGVLGLRTDKAGSFADYLALAEQRIFYGNGQQPPLRVREMEGTATLTLVDGAVQLPDDYLDKRGIKWTGSVTVSVHYEPPSIFEESEARRRGAPYPLAYTIEGDQLRVQPALSGDLALLYYKRPAAMVADEDTNSILTRYPAIYLHACQIELWRDLRNFEEQGRSEREFSSAVMAANRQSGHSRRSGVPLRKKVGMWQC